MAAKHDAWLVGIGVDVVSVRDRVQGRVKETEFRSNTANADEVAILSAQGEVRRDGSVAGKGFVAKFKTADQDGEFTSGEILSGEFEVGENGASGKGVIAKGTRARGVTDTVGEFEFSQEKASVVGVKREADLAAASGLLPGNIVAKGDAALGTASLDRSANDDTISVGAQANIAEGSVTVGTSGTKRADGSDSDLDQTFRFGLSAGGGLAGRVHFADADKDGNPEFGVGADFGPVSFDVKTEDPMGTGVALMQGVSPGGGLATAGHLLFGDSESNMTKDVMEATVGATPKEGLDAGRGLVGMVTTDTPSERQEQTAGGTEAVVGVSVAVVEVSDEDD